jgi:hypothetical protein
MNNRRGNSPVKLLTKTPAVECIVHVDPNRGIVSQVR